MKPVKYAHKNSFPRHSGRLRGRRQHEESHGAYADIGIDPIDHVDSIDHHASDIASSRQRRDQHKARRLCRQAFRILSLALGDFAHDPILADLAIQSVDPAPDASRLVVCVYSLTQPPLLLPEVYAKLEEISGRLRHELAQHITRKRAPELAFIYMPAAAGEEQ